MEETFNIKELSTYLKCSVSEIRKLVKEKNIPFYRVGRKIYCRKESIDKWIIQQEINNLLDNVADNQTKPI